MLGLDTSWYIGSPATSRPLANEPSAPPKRRRRLVRGCKFGFPARASSQLELDLAAQTPRKGKEEPSAASVRAHALREAARARKERPRRARARTKPWPSSTRTM